PLDCSKKPEPEASRPSAAVTLTYTVACLVRRRTSAESEPSLLTGLGTGSGRGSGTGLRGGEGVGSFGGSGRGTGSGFGGSRGREACCSPTTEACGVV